MFFLAIPFIRKDHKFIIWAIPLFTSALILTALSFERPGISFITGYGGFMLIGPSAFLVVSIIIQKFSKENKIRNNIIFLAVIIIAGISLILASAVGLPTFRYLNAVNPFLTTIDPLTDSVAEHQTTTLELSFYYSSILMIFAGIGIWLLFRNKRSSNNDFTIKSDMTIFALIIGLLGIYISSAFVRLEVYAAISVIILSSIGLSIITTEIIRKRPSINNHGKIIKISYLVIIIALLIIPITLPANANWIKGIKAPPTLLNGGSTFNIATNDWPDAMEWIKNNTPKDAVVTSWWDYGYWITTLGDRKSSADNATLIDWQIKLIAKMLLSSPEDAWKILTSDEPQKGLDTDYVLIYLTAQRGNDEEPGIYILHGGGDESKKIWFMRIGGVDESKYLYSDGTSGTDLFWQNTLLGKMFPFSVITYANFQNNQQSDTYRAGFTEIHRLNIKYPADGNGPLRLVYASPSLYRATAGPISAVLIYEVNKDYQPNKTETVDVSVETEKTEEISESLTDIQERKEIAVITTAFGDITIQLKEDIAPKTVENFKKLAQSGFYDGTIFHRIIPGFVIQGGDPNTVSGTSDTWGFGGPGYTIPAEFSNLSHKKYIVSMARSAADINSAGSQFFIVLQDAPSLDGQYTVFGEVISGQDVVEKIASLETNSLDQPLHPVDARIEKIIVFTP
jgi:dolichyl-diphosphooligosaccharide--protein glycosyltransferase